LSVLMALAVSSCSAGVPRAWAQYAEYPRQVGGYQHFKSNILPSWMSLDFELRGRTEDQTAINLISGQNQLYELTRVHGGMEIRASDWAIVYLQFHDDHALGLPLKYTAANMRDTFDLRQGYLDLHSKSVRFIAGRQELRYGDERVVGISDWTNTSRTWDGFLLRVGNKNKLDLFTTSVVIIHPTSLDTHGAGLTFHGAVGTLTTLLPKTTFQPFLLVRALPRVRSQQGIYGNETEFTPGIIATRAPNSGLDYTVTGTIQRGTYSNDSIHAGSAIIKIGYTEEHLPWSPRVGFEYDFASGNAHRNPMRISTNDQQYPSNHNAFGLVDLFGFQNIQQFRGDLDLTPLPNLSLFLQTGSLQLATSRDNVYNGSGAPLVNAPVTGFSGKDIGTEFDASAKYVLKKYLVINVGVGHFFPGQVMTQNGHNVPLTLSYFALTYRFRVN
jgi:Alginate export